MKRDRDIIFFDGVCNLCDGFINFTVARDQKSDFYISSLQGNAAAEYLKTKSEEPLKTVLILLKNGNILKKSRAVFYIMKKLGGVYSIISLFRILPAFFTDFLYDVIAANRYRIFGKKETCRIPTEQERSYFID